MTLEELKKKRKANNGTTTPRQSGLHNNEAVKKHQERIRRPLLTKIKEFFQ